MKKYVLVALTKAFPGREAEFVEWYDRQHIPDTLKIEGIVGAQRFMMDGPPKGAETPAWEVMVLYDVVTDDIDRTMKAVAAAAGTAAMPMSDALDMSATVRLLAYPAAERVDKT